MPEYIEKEALIKTVCEQYRGAMNTFFAQPNDFVCIIEDAPAADVVEIVRCKDCEYRMEIPNGTEFKGRKPMHCICHSKVVSDNGYCDFGIKKRKDLKQE